MSSQPDRLSELNRILPRVLPAEKPKYKVKVWQRNRLIRIGDEEHTLTEWCRIRGINYGAAYQRLADGLGIDVALTPGKLGRKGARIVINGEEMSIREAARRHGMSYTTLHWRLSEGLPIEVATRVKVERHCERLRERVAELERKR